MLKENEKEGQGLTRSRLRSPRAAAIAGIAFALLAGTFMSVLGTIWFRTGVMPRWLALVTYALSAVLLISISFTLWVILIFPSWVFVISIAILVLNYRLKLDEQG